MEIQSQYRNLHHISYREIAVCQLTLWNSEGSHGCWRILSKEASWSKCTYTYAVGVCLRQLDEEEEFDKEGKERKEQRSEEVKPQYLREITVSAEDFMILRTNSLILSFPFSLITYLFFVHASSSPRIIQA
jgi:hypothetical protein